MYLFLEFNVTKQSTLFSNKNSRMIKRKGIKCYAMVEFSINIILKNEMTFLNFKGNKI